MRTIDADALDKRIREWSNETEREKDGTSLSTVLDILEIIGDAPTAERTTRIVRKYSRPNVYADLWMHCEACGGRMLDNWRYYFCPKCGARVTEQEGYEY